MSGVRSKRRVLVIDDDKKVLRVCEELLTRRDYAVTTCRDSTQAIPLVKRQAFDIVLLDIRMPGFEGTDLLPLLKKIHPDLPVILVSAYCDKAELSRYHALGAFDAISKPFSHELLLETIARALTRQEQIPLVLTGLSLREGKEQLYRKLIVTALHQANWNQVKAAKLLGISRYGLIRWLKQLEISYDVK